MDSEAIIIMTPPRRCVNKNMRRVQKTFNDIQRFVLECFQRNRSDHVQGGVTDNNCIVTPLTEFGSKMVARLAMIAEVDDNESPGGMNETSSKEICQTIDT